MQYFLEEKIQKTGFLDIRPAERMALYAQLLKPSRGKDKRFWRGISLERGIGIYDFLFLEETPDGKIKVDLYVMLMKGAPPGPCSEYHHKTGLFDSNGNPLPSKERDNNPEGILKYVTKTKFNLDDPDLMFLKKFFKIIGKFNED